MKKQNNDLTQGNITVQLLRFGLPITASMILQNFYNLADTYIVGHYLGEDAIAAVGNTASVNQLMLLLTSGATTGMSVIISQYYGAGEKQEKNVKKTIMTSLYLIVALSVVIGVLGAIYCRPILKFMMNVPETILDDSVSYLRIIFLGMIVTALYNMAFNIFKALGDSMTPMIVLALTCVTNVILNILFVSQFHMGIPGVAYATVLATAISAIVCLILLWKKQPLVHPAKEVLPFDAKIAKDLVRIGLPSALLSGMMAIGNIITQRYVNGYGATVMAAYTTARNVEMLITYIPGGLSGAIQTFTGQNIGARNYDRIKQGYRSMLIISAFYTVISMFVLIVFGQNLAGLFSSEGGSMAEISGEYLRIVAYGQFPLVIMYMTKSTLLGAGDAMASAYTGILEVIGRVGSAVFLSRIFGYAGVFAGPPIGWVLAMMYSIVRYRSGQWMKKGVTNQEE